MERIFQGLDQRSANLAHTVLASQAIEAELRRTGRNRFDLWVRCQDRDKAIFHLDQYQEENPATFGEAPLPGLLWPFLAPSVLVLAAGLALIHMGLVLSALLDTAIFRFGASPYFLGQGQSFRAVTALFLHADAQHLLGNLAGLLVLASPLVRVTGPGTGLFFLLAAAVTGNLISNGLAMDARLSIGASTAVMAAAGLLSARQALAGKRPWLPLASGLVLMVFFSHGERTDLGAHLFGFLAGAGVGLLVFPLFPAWHRPFMEPLGLGLGLALCAGAVLSGLSLL